LVDFELVYGTDLVFRPECWKLCGDAHCCTFGRHKARFALIGRGAAQELPLLPGELDFLVATGRLGRFARHQVRRAEYRFGPHRLGIDSLVIAEAACGCDHDARTTVCRLYPVQPVFDEAGHLAGIERLGIYDQLESLDGGETICRIDSVPLSQMPALLAITSAIAADPVALFHVMAYDLAHKHVSARVAARKAARPASAFRIFETMFLRQELFDRDELDSALTDLAARFARRYGPGFRLA
jgi:hypothetical protein